MLKRFFVIGITALCFFTLLLSSCDNGITDDGDGTTGGTTDGGNGGATETPEDPSDDDPSQGDPSFNDPPSYGIYVKAEYKNPQGGGSILYTYNPARAYFTIDWTAVQGASGYNVYRSYVLDGDILTITKIADGLEGTSYQGSESISYTTDYNSAPRNTVCYYWVTAITGDGETDRPQNGGIKVTYTYTPEQRVFIPPNTWTVIKYAEISKTVEQNPVRTAEEMPTVTGVTITPAGTSVVRGGSTAFAAAVALSGTNIIPSDRTVIWTVTGGIKEETVISAAGTLKVAADEPAGSLVITAASLIDNTKKAAITVSVTNRNTGKGLYITGQDASDGNSACYWKIDGDNSYQISLMSGEVYKSAGEAITLVDNKLYIAGWRGDVDDGFIGYWVDDGSSITWNELSTGQTVNDMAVVSGNIYLALDGYIGNSTRGFYWFNSDMPVTLPIPKDSANSSATGIAVAPNGTIYISGNYKDYSSGINTAACLWKISGTEITYIPVDPEWSWGEAIVYDQSYIYIAGGRRQFDAVTGEYYVKAGYWKIYDNADITSADITYYEADCESGLAYSIALKGSGIIFGGEQVVGDTTCPCCWDTEGNVLYYDSQTQDGWINSIIVASSDTYYSAGFYKNSDEDWAEYAWYKYGSAGTRQELGPGYAAALFFAE